MIQKELIFAINIGKRTSIVMHTRKHMRSHGNSDLNIKDKQCNFYNKNNISVVLDKKVCIEKHKDIKHMVEMIN